MIREIIVRSVSNQGEAAGMDSFPYYTSASRHPITLLLAVSYVPEVLVKLK